MSIRKIATLIIFMAFLIIKSAMSAELPLQFSKDQVGNLTITNVGSCPIYKLQISTVPPGSGFIGIAVELGALLVGKNSFEKTIGTLEKGYYITINQSELINQEGRKLSDDYVIGYWHFSGNYCGDYGSVNFQVKEQ